MEPHKNEMPPESTGEDQVKQQRPPERKRRFQIVKLEERIAPVAPDIPRSYLVYCTGGHGHSKGNGCA